MLKHWDTHAEYQHFISEAVTLLNPSQLKRLHSMSDSWNKLTSMNLDPVGDFLAPFYSDTGRPAIHQPQILRSLVLMLDRKFTSLTNWVAELQSDDLLAMLIGCSPGHLPPLGSYFDFIDRLCLQNPEYEKLGRGDLFPADKNKKPSSRPGKGKKLPNTPVLQKKWLIMHCRSAAFLFITRKPCNNFSLLLPLSLRWNSGSLILIILLYQEMAHVSIHMQIPTGTGSANALIKVSQAACVHVISLTLTHHGDGIVILMLIIMDILFTCSRTTTINIRPICLYISVFSMRNGMTASPE